MELNFLIDVQFLSQLDQNTIDGVEIIAIVSSCGCEVKDHKIIILLIFHERLMILVPFDQKSLFADSTIGLDDERLVVFSSGLQLEPFFNHEIVLFHSTSRLILIEAEHDVGCAE